MEKLKFDLTTQEGLISTQQKLKVLKTNSKILGVIIDVDIEGIVKELINMISRIFDRLFDLLDDTKKLEKQMELALKTIEIARLAGAKSIDITLNSKNDGNFKLYIKKIKATIGGELKKDNTITYSIKFE
jgi:hypothetical protein